MKKGLLKKSSLFLRFQTKFKNKPMLETQICIIGAGPGGAATALRLAQLGIPSVLLDKATFPRDKICGDGLTARTKVILDRIDPNIIASFEKMTYQNSTWGVSLILDNKSRFNVPLRKNYNTQTDSPPSFVSKRLDFDNHLILAVKKQPLINFMENISIDSHEFHENTVRDDSAAQAEAYWILKDKKTGFQIKTQLVIAANGANSPFTRHACNIDFDPKHAAAAVRAYYKNVAGCHTDNFIELHFLEGYLPGYFWIFPLPNGEANVGFGMLSDTISKRKINLKKTLLDILETRSGIKERFENASLDGEIIGFPLPMGSKRQNLSGNNYMLVGDAACLIDPLTGEGIGNAINSGLVAADQAEKCVKAQNFSADFMKDYDKRIWRVMGPELKMSHRMQRLGKYPIVFNFVLWLASRNTQISELVYAMFNNSDIRNKMINPIFWFKMLVNAK
jgi:menaquinone-9 beta-reductase